MPGKLTIYIGPNGYGKTTKLENEKQKIDAANPNNTIFFNQENIDRVVFKGFVDEEEERFIEIYQNWEKSLTIPKKKID